MIEPRYFEIGKRMNQVADSLDMPLEKVVKAITFELFKRIVEKTPRDTGRAKASWNPAVGQIDPSVHPEIPDDAKLGNDAANAVAFAKIAKLDFSEFQEKFVWISNNLPYIGALEDGWSKQSGPNNMVAMSVQDVLTDMEKIVREALNG